MSGVKQINSLPQDFIAQNKGNAKTNEQSGELFGKELLQTVKQLEAMDSEIEAMTQGPVEKNSTSMSTQVGAVGDLINDIAGLMENFSKGKPGKGASTKLALAQYDKMSKK